MARTVIKAKFKWNKELLESHGLEPGGRVQQAIDSAVIRYDMPYVPFKTGTLATSPYRTSPIGSGYVVYEGPYARYQYYGEVWGPNYPRFEDDSGVPTSYRSPEKKHPTGRPLQYNKDTNPLAGSYWFERMKAVHAEDIVREANEAAKESD